MYRKLVGIITCTLLIVASVYSVSSMISEVTYDEDTPYSNTAKQSIDTDIVAMIQQVNESLIAGYLEGLVSFGPRVTGSKNCSDAADYILDEFKKLGLDAYIDPWTYPRYSCQNVVATHYGTDISSDAIIIICAHYDSYENSPGANDDGSGIAAMLSIANICSTYSFNYTIRFIAFSGEEAGTYGSHAYAKNAYEKRENIRVVFNLETFGNTSEGGKDLFILKTERTEWISQFSQEISEKYYPFCNLTILPIGNRPCDHQAFLEYGYDAVQYVQLNRGDYPMHTPEDSLDKINYSYLVNVTKLILAIVVEFVNRPIDVQIRIISPYEGYFYFMDTPMVQLPGFNIRKSGLRGMTYILGKATVRVNISTKSEIQSVYFCIDGVADWLGECKQPPYEWKIQKSIIWSIFPLFGKHTISAYACTKDGKVTYDEMDIFVMQLF